MKNEIIQFLRENIIGKILLTGAVYKLENGNLEGVYNDKMTFSNLVTTENGFKFNMTTVTQEQVYNLDDKGARTTIAKDYTGTSVFCYELAMRKSTKQITGYMRCVSTTVQDSTMEAVVCGIFDVTFDGKELKWQENQLLYRDNPIGEDKYKPVAFHSKVRFYLDNGKVIFEYLPTLWDISPDTLEKVDKILEQIEVDISEIDLYGYDIIETSLSMVHKLQSILNDLRMRVQTYVFPTKEDEILFFKMQKPEILARLLFFYKIYRIETQCPNGSDEVIRSYINRELDNLTYFFNRNLDFYQYYRSHSTVYDEYYFVRGNADLRLCTDSAQFDKDPNFSTGYDYKVAKIIANEMLRIYLNKRLVKLETNNQIEDNLQKYLKYPFRFTGKKVFLIELGYALVSAGDINNGNVEIKEMMKFLSTVFQVDLGDYYASYIAMKERKDRTAYLHHLIDSLIKRMNEDDMKC